MKLLLGLLIFNFIFPAHSYEVDNFSMRYQKLEASDAILDKKVNEAFLKVIERANEENIGCTKSPASDKSTRDGHRKFRGLLRQAIAPGGVVGVFEDMVDGNASWLSSITGRFQSKIPKHSVAIEDSIYGGAEKKFILGTAGINSSIRLGGEYIGADKLGHFFDQGYEYFQRWTLNGSESGVFAIGKSAEEGFFGRQTTGIKSYGDLSANYSGFQFWKNVTDGPRPYFTCENGKWSQVRKFHWADHVHAGWDEAINCSSYGTEDLKTAAAQNVKKLETIYKKRFTCPVDERACERLAQMSGARHFIHPDCMKFKNSTTRSAGYLSPTPATQSQKGSK